MVTKELLDYISSSKTSGMSEDQIRQNLISQGWHADEVNQALNGNPSPILSNTAPTTATFPFWLKVVLGLFILSAVGYFAFTTFTGGVLNNNNVNSDQFQQTDRNSGNDSNNAANDQQTTQNLCGNWPSEKIFAVYNPSTFVNSTQVPSEFPPDFPLPADAQYLGDDSRVRLMPLSTQTKIGHYYFCSDSSVSNVSAIYDELNSDTKFWRFSKMTNIPIPISGESYDGEYSLYQILGAGRKLPHPALPQGVLATGFVHVVETGDKTLILFIYGALKD